jgi:DNA gyrase subunit B
MHMTDKKYNASSIKVLEGLEAVRKRPAMYIGDTGLAGLHHLVSEVVDNSIDEAMAGYCKNIAIHIYADGSCSVRDDGRGIPVDMHETEHKPAVEVAMTVLHAGGKFDRDSYKVSGGLHGVGVSCVNALSEWMQVEVYRDGKIHMIRFERGHTVNPLTVTGTTQRTGTKVTFKPDKEIFPDVNFRYETLSARLRELAYLNEGIIIKFKDDRSGKEEEFHYPEGLKAFVEHLSEGKTILHPVIRFSNEDPQLKLTCEVAMQYNDGYTENTFAFANNIHNIDGGTHMSGFRSALTRTMNAYGKKQSFLKGNLVPTGEDLREGLIAIVSVKVPEPQFEAQTKVRLMNPEVGTFVEQTVNDKLSQWLEEHPADGKRIVTKATQAAQAREAARKARELSRKSVLESGSLPGKLWDCSSKDNVNTEMFLVEGDSASGSAKQGRESKLQAILPLKGKILNVEKARIDKVLDHTEIRTLISAIGTGIGTEDFDMSKRRYGRIVIMTDADVDGSHIRTLLLTFFFRHMRPLIEEGHVYIAQPPLFQLAKRSKVEYVLNEKVMNERLTNLGTEGTFLIVRKINEKGEITKEVAGEYSGDQLKTLINLIDELEVNLGILSRRAVEIKTFLTEQYDKENRFPTISAHIKNTARFFHTEKEFSEFCEQMQAKYGRIEIDDGTQAAEQEEQGEPAQEAQAQTPVEESKPAVVIVRTDMSEVADINRIAGVLGETYHFMIKDYFRNWEENVAGQVLPTRFGLKLVEGEMRDIPNIPAIPKTIREYGSTGLEIKRFKGLGEMNPEELWSTTMDPTQRSMQRVTISEEPDDPAQYQIDIRETDRIFSILMGESVDQRRTFIETHASEVKNLDV